MGRVMRVLDNYGFERLVWGVYVEELERGRQGQLADAELDLARATLAVLEGFAAADAGPFLVGEALSLADLWAVPMVAYLRLAPAGRQLLRECPRLEAWFAAMAELPSVMATRFPLERTASAPVAAAEAQEEKQQRLTIRAAERSDYERIVEIVNDAFAHWSEHRLEPEYARVSVPELIEELEQGGELSELLVCVDDEGTLLGSVLLNQWYAAEDFASAGRPDTESFGQLAVATAAQGRGVGAALVRAAEERARARGKRRMDICFVSVDAPKLSRFYAGLGYREGETSRPTNLARLRPECATNTSDQTPATFSVAGHPSQLACRLSWHQVQRGVPLCADGEAARGSIA